MITDEQLTEIETTYKRRYGLAYEEVHKLIAELRNARAQLVASREVTEAAWAFVTSPWGAGPHPAPTLRDACARYVKAVFSPSAPPEKVWFCGLCKGTGKSGWRANMSGYEIPCPACASPKEGGR